MTSPTPSVPNSANRLDELASRLRVLEGLLGASSGSGPSTSVAFSPYNGGSLTLWPRTVDPTWTRLWVWRANLDYRQWDFVVYQALSAETVVAELRVIMDDSITIWGTPPTAGTRVYEASVDMTEIIGDQAGTSHKFALEARLSEGSPAGTVYAMFEGLVTSAPVR